MKNSFNYITVIIFLITAGCISQTGVAFGYASGRIRYGDHNNLTNTAKNLSLIERHRGGKNNVKSVNAISKEHLGAKRLLVGVAKTTNMLKSVASDTIRGVVTDAETGASLPGVNIIIKGTTIGAATDYKGRYTLVVHSLSDTLLVSYIGYNTLTVPIQGRHKINVKLNPKVVQGKQVVVVGYGTETKQSVVGAISQASGAKLLEAGNTSNNVANGLTGMFPGVIVEQSSGIPGGVSSHDNSTQIYIRGLSTWNGGAPLILIDGVQSTIQDMQDMNASDIQNISVLKDASSTAVFGVKGANGVILITTKRGEEGKTKLSFNFQSSLKSVSKLPNVVGSYEGLLMRNYAILNELPIDGSSWNYFTPQNELSYYKNGTYPQLFPNVNWQKVMIKPVAPADKINMDIRGGTKFVKYYGSLGYIYEGDILKTENLGQGYDPSYKYNRFNFRTNLDFNITSSTEFTANFAGDYGIQQQPAGDFFNYWKGIYGHPPDLYPIKYTDGVYADYAGFDRYPNPFYLINFGGIDRNNRTNLQTNFTLKQNLDFITKGLSVKAMVSYNNYFASSGPNINDAGRLREYIPPGTLNMSAQDSLNSIIYLYPNDYTNLTNGYDFVPTPLSYSAQSTTAKLTNKALNYRIAGNYKRSFGDNTVSGLLLMSRRISSEGAGFNSYQEDYVGRLTYNYNQKYFIEVNGDYDGSEKFSNKYRFGFFPSVGVGWLVSNESWFQAKVPFINYLKLRYSNGLVGSDSGIQRWQYVSNGVVLNEGWQFGLPVPQSSYDFRAEGTIANPDIHWETAEKQDLGMDAKFLKNTFSVTFDYFWERRWDMLISQADRTTNVLFGANLPAANLGKVNSHGYELDVNFTKRLGQVDLQLHATHSFSIDKIIARDDPGLEPAYEKQAGFQIGQVRTQVNQGIIQSWDQVYTGVPYQDNSQVLPGDFRQIDYNADGVIDNKDVVPWGYSDIPQHTYTFGFDVSFKHFTVSANFYGVYNVSQVNNYTPFYSGYTLVEPFLVNQTWSPGLGQTQSATYNDMRYNTNNDSGNYWVWDASFLRLQNAQISYSLPKHLIHRMGVSNLRIYVNGNNLLYWSKLPVDLQGSNPDGSNGSNAASKSYPVLRRVNFGLDITF